MSSGRDSGPTFFPLDLSTIVSRVQTHHPPLHSPCEKNICTRGNGCKGTLLISDLNISVFPDLMAVIPTGLHVCVLLFCALLVVFSSVTSAFCLYNAFGSPYETLHGPLGLYLWNLISCLCGSMVLILFASEVKIHRLSEKIANFNEKSFVYKTRTEQFDRCFWMVFFIFLTHAVNILLVRLTGVHFPFPEAKEPELSAGASDLMY
ncbi:clarin-1 isoform X2 [Arapaima gigas]